MTLNAVVNRIKIICEAHGQVRSFGHGLLTDFLNDHTKEYSAVYLISTGGQIGLSSRAAVFTFTIFFLDLAHTSEDTKTNELDVQSDQVSIALDVFAQMNRYNDWAVSQENSLTLKAENEGDFLAGCSVDFSIRVMYPQNTCQIP